MADDEPRPGRAEIALMRWSAQEGLMSTARKFEQQWDLDPELTLALEDACREDDVDLILEALVEIWDAAEEARGLDQGN